MDILAVWEAAGSALPTDLRPRHFHMAVIGATLLGRAIEEIEKLHARGAVN